MATPSSKQSIDFPDVDPWSLLPVREVLVKIENAYDPKYLRDQCFTRGLIGIVKKNSLSKKVDTPGHNQDLLEEVVKGGWTTFDIFLEILKGYDSLTLKHFYDKMITARDAGLGSPKQAPAAPTPAAPAPTAGAAPPTQHTDPVPAWSSQCIAEMNNKKIVGGKLASYLVTQEKDTVAREVVREIDEVQADTAATILIEYCRENSEVIVSAGHYNMTGLLYYIGEHKSDMTCQKFVDIVGKHVPGKKTRVERAFNLAEFI